MCSEIVAFGLNQMELDLTVLAVIVLFSTFVGMATLKYVNKGL